MSASLSRGSLGLLAAGAVAVLLLGAFVPSQPVAVPVVAPSNHPAENPVDSAMAEPANEPDLSSEFSPGLAEIVKLAQAHVDENTILAFIRTSGQKYSPTADEIVYLANLGVSQKVLAALVKPSVSPAEPVITAAAASVEPARVDAPPEGPSSLYLASATDIPAENCASSLAELPPLEMTYGAPPSPPSAGLSVLFLVPGYPAAPRFHRNSTVSTLSRSIHWAATNPHKLPQLAPVLPPPAPPPPLYIPRATVTLTATSSKSGR